MPGQVEEDHSLYVVEGQVTLVPVMAATEVQELLEVQEVEAQVLQNLAAVACVRACTQHQWGITQAGKAQG